LLGVILMPYFLSRPSVDAITTDAQSVSGMKPILTSGFSGASEPAAHAPLRTSGSTSVITLAPAMVASARRRPWQAGAAFAAAVSLARWGFRTLRREGMRYAPEREKASRSPARTPGQEGQRSGRGSGRRCPMPRGRR